MFEIDNFSQGSQAIEGAVVMATENSATSVVGGGDTIAGLAYATGAIYLLKGNNTPEFWQYMPAKQSVVRVSDLSSVINIQADKIRPMIRSS